jgi:hypothetical protein
MMITWTLGTLISASGGCADFTGGSDPTGGLPDVAVAMPSFATDVRPIFVKRCALGGCHSLAARQQGLVLTADSAYDALVGRPSRLGRGMPYVTPGKADSSWVVAMIGPDPARRLGVSRMPLASTPLTTNQIATIVNWIDAGARRN